LKHNTSFEQPVIPPQPGKDRLELAHKYFGEEWNNWLVKNAPGFKSPVKFMEIIALALENLTIDEHKHLLLSFLSVQLKSNTINHQLSLSSAIEFKYYDLLHSETFKLIESGEFRESSMTSLLKQIPELRRKEKELRNTNIHDESIIDITKESVTIKNDTSIIGQDESEVPYWEHRYIYSYNELNYATSEQKKFYSFFKKKFLEGIFLDIKGNYNYAFILLFDLLLDYDNDRDLVKLEYDLNALGKHYPKTESYAQDFLIKKMGEVGDEEGIKRIENEKYTASNYYSRDYIDAFHLGNKYSKKLNLNHEEITLLNKFWNPNNVFLSIEGCCIAAMKFYLLIVKELENHLIGLGTSLSEEIRHFQSILRESFIIDSHYSWTNFGISYYNNKVESDVYLTIFKRAESALRDSFIHKRKISIDFPYSISRQKEFEDRIGNYVNEIIQSSISKIDPPDEETEIELNAQNVNRWKVKFDYLTRTYNEKSKEGFINGIYELGKSNKKNPAIENIFFEASKFIGTYDHAEALKFYIYYLYYDLKSEKIDNKQLAKTIQKKLFKTNEQLHAFEKVVAELVSTRNLEKALEDVVRTSQPIRKKVLLDKEAIKMVQKKDRNTVEVLNDYLQDEFENEGMIVKAHEINTEEIELNIHKKEVEASFHCIDGIILNKSQEGLMSLFAGKTLHLLASEVDEYCESNKIFKHQLIDSINEIFFEVLGDNLIEEEGDNYIINENYYQKVVLL
jgi:hypothetical protein